MTSVACAGETGESLAHHSGLDDALAAFSRNLPAIVVDDYGMHPHAELCCPGDGITTSTMAFLIAETSGLVIATLPSASAERLELPLMDYKPASTAGRYCVAVDAHDVATTGISASDRAITVRRLASGNVAAGGFTRPGHVIPAVAGGHFAVIKWTCYDAAHALSRAAGLSGVVACAALIDGVSTPGLQAISALSARYSIPVVRSSEVRDRALAPTGASWENP
jgi:3,4-dihydroxy 2-butanone 4-phosphate synthase/GTP cyclohydrolase II